MRTNTAHDVVKSLARIAASPISAFPAHLLSHAYAVESDHLVGGWRLPDRFDEIGHRPGDGHAIGLALGVVAAVHPTPALLGGHVDVDEVQAHGEAGRL